jgi:hypothetical protein
MSSSKRGPQRSIGPKILLAAVFVVAGVIGISGIYPQVIDAEWVQDATGTHLPKMTPPTTDATIRRSGIVAAIPLPPRRAPTTTTGLASASSPGPAPELSQLRSSVTAVVTPAEAATPLALAAIPDAEAKAEALPADPAAAAPAKPADNPRVAYVKKKVVVQHRQRGYSRAYAQYGGGWGGGRGRPGMGSAYNL